MRVESDVRKPVRCVDVGGQKRHGASMSQPRQC